MAASSDVAQAEATKAGAAASPNAIDPIRFEAAVFDLDGVLTETAAVHAQAWKRLFDEFLAKQAAATGSRFQPFDADSDYHAYVDGRPRSDGVRTFLAARGITLPEGGPGDPPDADTVSALGARKDAYFLERLAQSGREGVPRRPAVARQPARRGPEDGAGLLQPQRQGGAGGGRADGADRRGGRWGRSGAAGAEGQAGAGHLPAGPPAARRPGRPRRRLRGRAGRASRRSAPPATGWWWASTGWATRPSSSRTAPTSPSPT